jgi:rhodanese-related sulfurtransferase
VSRAVSPLFTIMSALAALMMMCSLSSAAMAAEEEAGEARASFNINKFYPGAILPATDCPPVHEKPSGASQTTLAPFIAATPTYQDAAQLAESANLKIATDGLVIGASLYDAKTMKLVDIRSAKEIARIRIPEALTIDRSALMSRQFLRQQSLLLVGEDAEDQSLTAFSQQLRDGGFRDVAVLRNGIRGWLAAGRPAQIAPGAIQELTHLTAMQFHAWRQHRNTKFVWLGSPKTVPAELGTVDVIDVFAHGKGASRATMLQSATRQKLQPSTALIVLLPESPDVAKLEDLDSLLADAAIAASGYRLAVVSEGWSGYQKFLAQQQAMIAQKDLSLQRPCSSL